MKTNTNLKPNSGTGNSAAASLSRNRRSSAIRVITHRGYHHLFIGHHRLWSDLDEELAEVLARAWIELAYQIIYPWQLIQKSLNHQVYRYLIPT
jgi:hypothetical protein